MSPASVIFYSAVGVATIAFVAGAVRAARHHPDIRAPRPIEIVIGAVVNFFDALGIGSFAPTTALCKVLKLVPDEDIPGTLNAGLTAAALLESVIYVTAIIVDPLLLIAMVASAAAGAWIGAGIVARLPRRPIQVGMGIALLIAGCVFVAINLHLLPGGGTAMNLTGWRFFVAVGVNFVLGALMGVGIGNYAPCMVTLALLGMHPIAAFPIMMGSCALIQPIASLRFFETGRFGWGTCVGLSIGGIVGVLIAAYLVKSLPLETLRWMVTFVIAYAAFAMLRSAIARPVPAPA
ncbi:MAG: TSUP family transporter [Steroidobacterales bacterium]